jgi:ParB family chromosome partitioning protein
VTLEPSARLLSAQELAELGPPEAVRLPLDLVDAHPLNPRAALPEIDLLADDIKANGLLQPIAVRRTGDRYELVAGHRRRAAVALNRERYPHDAEWRTIAAVVRTMDDEATYLALLSAQLHSRDWLPREEAAALERLAESRTLREVGALVHRGEPWVSKRLRIYADSVLSGYVQTSKLSTSVAEELLQVRDPAQRRDFADQAVKERWTPGQARTAARRLKLDSHVREVARRARELVDVLASVEPGRLPVDATRDLWTLHGRIEVLARGGAPTMPTVEQAERAAGVRSGAPRRKSAPARRKPGYKPKL